VSSSRIAHADGFECDKVTDIEMRVTLDSFRCQLVFRGKARKRISCTKAQWISLQLSASSQRLGFREMPDDTAVFEIIALRRIVDVQLVEDQPLAA
jgi:hypothetical protein